MLDQFRIKRKSRPAGRLRSIIEAELADTEPSAFELAQIAEAEAFELAQWAICAEDMKSLDTVRPPYDDAWDPEMAFMFHIDYTLVS